MAGPRVRWAVVFRENTATVAGQNQEGINLVSTLAMVGSRRRVPTENKERFCSILYVGVGWKRW